ncbi:14944_t:CDS:1, partial [Acaulospora colombiana]
ISGSSPEPPEASQTNIADVADGAAHIADPGPNADDGEEMLERIDTDLGGSDSSPTGDSVDGSNFILAGASITPEASPSTEIVGLREGVQIAPLETEVTRTVQGHRQAITSTPAATSSSGFVIVQWAK